MIAAGADTLSREKPFVCQTTPHFGSTLRKASYSVWEHHTTKIVKSKSLKWDIFCKGENHAKTFVENALFATKIPYISLAF